MNEEKLVGLSLSQCIRDIITGLIRPEQVVYIVCGTAHRDLDDVEAVAEYYKDSEWKANPEAAKAVLRDLVAFGRIIQPREFNKPGPNIVRGHWAVVSVIEHRFVAN